jgi:hypothetical protein
MDWSIFLFILKWIFLGLVYLVLILLLVGVTREMRLRIPRESPTVASAGIARLRVIQPGTDPNLQPGATIPLQPDTLIGAQRGSTLILHDRYISGRHARLRWDGISWWIEDLNSTNGTFVNRHRLAPGAPQPFPSGSVLEIGDMSFEMVE